MAELIRVAQVRICPIKGDLEKNAARLYDVLDRISPHSPDVVVTPECFIDGYVATEESVTGETLCRYAVDTSSSQYTEPVARWAKDNRCWVILGCSRLADDGVYNSALIYDRDGRMAGIYDKTHCQAHDTKFVPGGDLPVFESDFGPFGILICADRRWPETVRTLALGGARVIFNPTYGAHGDKNQHMMETRSFESEIIIVFTHPEQSLVTGLSGEVLCNERSPDAGFSAVELDLSQVDEARSAEGSHLRDRRPELYCP